MKNLFILVLLAFFVSSSQAQIINGQDTLYGNEWINFDQSYFKLMVAEDGIYRVSQQALANANLPLNSIQGSQFQLFHNGEEVPIYTTTDGVFNSADYIEFYGQKNTSELDRHLFKDPDAEMMNPRYSLFTDTAAYFLTWNVIGTNQRYTTITNDLNNLPPKEEYYVANYILNYTSTFSKKSNAQNISSSDYGLTEGYSNAFANIQTIAINPPNAFAGGPDGQLNIRYGTNIGEHQQLITLNDQPLITDEFSDFQVRQLSFDIPNASLQSAMSLKFQGLAASTDRQRIANIILRYPAQWKASNQAFFSFEMPASPSIRYIEIENFNAAGGTPIFYDLTNRTRLTASFENNLVKIALPPTATSVQFVLVNDATGVKAPTTPAPIQFIDYKNINAQFILLSNPRLYDDGSGNNYVQQYADYRSSAVGGGYSTVIVDVQQVYDQFGWGLNRHPLSIRDFAHYVKKHWADVQYFFVVGKGREYTNVRAAVQLSNANNVSYYVPTFGLPGSDNLLLAGADGYTPLIPIGRIAATGPEDIHTYLNKLKEFEANKNAPQTLDDRAWMKNILHLGGGNGAVLSEQLLIRSYLEDMAEILENGRIGASTKAYYKTSTDPIQQPQTEEIFDYLNNGVSIITFFGHSSVGVFDFSIDFPDNWQNKGKYPWMVSLGCYAGNIHTSSVGQGERFLFLKDAGSIAFTATAGQGYISSLNTFTTKMYQELGSDYYNKGIGDILQKTIAHFQGNDFGVNLIKQQFNLLGDPSIKMNPAPGPDYLIDASTLKFSPESVNASNEQFNISFDVVNIGENLQDSIQLTIEQKLPDVSRITVVDTLVLAPKNKTSFSFNIPVLGKNSIGLNYFYIKADATSRIEEFPLPQAEINNELVMSNGETGAALFIRDNSAVPAYPQDFGIVGNNDITLKAYTTDPLAPSRKYLLQIDTTELFNSNLLLNTEISQSGGVIRWKPALSWKDETVYYWHITPDSLSPNEGYNWNASSFLYKNGSPEGWNQSHYYQFKKDELVNLELEGHGDWEYLDNLKEYRLRNAPYNVFVSQLIVNNTIKAYNWGSPSAGIYIVWIDSILLEPYWNYYPGNGPTSYGNPHPWGIDSHTFMFNSNQQGRAAAMNFLRNVIPDGEYVILFTVQSNPSSNFQPEQWAADSIQLGYNLFSILEQDGGAQLVRNLQNVGSVPYAIAYKKGGELLGEAIANTSSEMIELVFNLEGNWDKGFVNSTYLGPAASWETLSWKASSASNPESDTVSVDVFGTKSPGKEQVLLMENIIDMNVDLSAINAVEYPYLRLRFNSEDTLFRTTADLDFWRVTYHGVPEFAFNPAANFDLLNDTVQTGEPLKLVYQVENLSNNDGDSLLVKYAVINDNNEQSLIYQQLPVISANGSAIAELTVDTRNNKGEQNLLIELNPADDQPEIMHVNNFLQTTYLAQGDKRNPLLEVTFDGIQIIDGELVSPSPEIRISLTDENQFLLLDDTSRFKLFIIYPDSVKLTPIAIGNPEIRFTPASGGDKNRASIDFSPVFTSDGKYTLIIQARDVSGNASGHYDFKRTFEVITSSSISNFVNYPNPFSTSTRFVYTMTGAAPPARYKLQILTVSGRIVREVSQQELGELKAGTHLTDFTWDGKDEFGDQLANGVYLYRLLVEDENGEKWEKFETGADKYFKAGYGKMVLVR